MYKSCYGDVQDLSFSPYTQVSDDLSDNKVVDIPPPTVEPQGADNDDAVLNMAPDIPQRPRSVCVVVSIHKQPLQ